MEIKIIKCDGSSELKFLNALSERGKAVSDKAEETVAEILENVRKNGDAALIDYTEKFDGIKMKDFEVSGSRIKNALKTADAKFLEAAKRAAANITAFHKKQLKKGFEIKKKDGSRTGQLTRALNRVGIYVPGGTAAYPSSVLMNAIPAKLAGVKELIMVTPPGVSDEILAAAAICGVDRVFTVGGAQAIAALAYSTKSIPKVDKIVGPGNIYVATAKKMVFGTVDIDMIAGPSEILVLADSFSNPEFIAADLISQAEHDTLASAVLITTSREIAKKTVDALKKQTETAERKQIIEQSLSNYGGILITETITEMINLANELSPEHLEIMIKNPMKYLEKIENAGSIFLGDWSPEPLGDYFAGPNHVLPTERTARFFSPLSCDSFIKKSQYICYTKEALEKSAGDIMLLAENEGLFGHKNSIKVRKDRIEKDSK